VEDFHSILTSWRRRLILIPGIRLSVNLARGTSVLPIGHEHCELARADKKMRADIQQVETLIYFTVVSTRLSHQFSTISTLFLDPGRRREVRC